MPGRPLFYIVYGLIVLISFDLAAKFPANTTIQALPPNFLSGFVVVAFVDSLLRLAESRRRRPMEVIVQKNNSVARCRVKDVFVTALRAAERAGHIPAGRYDLSANLEVPASLAGVFGLLPMFFRMPDGTTLLARLAQDIGSAQETLTRSLDQYGSYQDPETAAWLADISHSTLFSVVDQLHRSGMPPTYVLPPAFWEPVIKAHNLLAGQLNRDAYRLGIAPSAA